jgi:hypothetical protein
MTAKERLLASLVRRDSSGAVQRLHAFLVATGFKWKDRNETMMYFSRDDSGNELGLVAMRPGLISFPRNFWERRPQALAAAVNALPANQRIRPDDGWFHSSQYSAGQLALDSSTEEGILRVIREVVVPEARKAGAKL